MTRRKNLTVALLSMLLVAVSIADSRGQGTTQSLTNEAIINLVSAGVPESTILYTIEHTATNFDLSSIAIEYLKHKGVSDKVIQAMQKKAGTTGAATPPAAGASPVPAAIPARAENPAPAGPPAPTTSPAPGTGAAPPGSPAAAAPPEPNAVSPQASGERSQKANEYPSGSGVFFRKDDKWFPRDPLRGTKGGISVAGWLTGFGPAEKEVWGYPEAHAKVQVSDAKPAFCLSG